MSEGMRADYQTLDSYAEWTDEVWVTPSDSPHTLSLKVLGLAGETGEVVELVKKYLRDGTPIDQANLAKELGDVLYYWARMCRHFGILPSDVMTTNVSKLMDRKSRGTIHGTGDFR